MKTIDMREWSDQALLTKLFNLVAEVDRYPNGFDLPAYSLLMLRTRNLAQICDRKGIIVLDTMSKQVAQSEVEMLRLKRMSEVDVEKWIWNNKIKYGL